MEQSSTAVTVLLDNNIDLVGNTIDPSYLESLDEAEEIEVAHTPKNGYGCLTINCKRYPSNITAIRRALAYVIDKTEIVGDVLDDLAEPLDRCVPETNPFSAETEVAFHHSDCMIERTNEILDEAGFEDVNNDSMREAPNGEEFSVRTSSRKESSRVAPIALFLRRRDVIMITGSQHEDAPNP